MLDIVLATKNKGKVKEIKKYFSDLSINFISLHELNFNEEIVENGKTFCENALIKARFITNKYNKTTIADDSGLVVDYLNGAPGIYSARYSGENATDKQNIDKLLNQLEGVEYSKRTAKFICSIALVFPEGNDLVVEGECKGIIINTPRGENGFGYDPVFFVPEYNKTMAEMDAELKNKISHRAKALEKLRSSFIKMI